MGLTAHSTGHGAVDQGLFIQKEQENDRVIALAGNPNVGKSTVFNALTGMNQHTGNWPGKTVTNAQGRYRSGSQDSILVDLPGTYSLIAHSAEEEVARDFICFGVGDITPAAVIVVCDATCLERNLNLVLQTIEITPNVVVCVNLMDEARRKGIAIDLAMLERKLGVPVIGACARNGTGLEPLMNRVDTLNQVTQGTPPTSNVLQPTYPKPIEDALIILEPVVENAISACLSSRWVALRLLDRDESLCKSINSHLGFDLLAQPGVQDALNKANNLLQENSIYPETLRDKIVTALIHTAEQVCAGAVFVENLGYNKFDRKLDKILTSKLTGIPVMLALLCVVFWLTITGANVPSQILADGLFWIQDKLTEFFQFINAPEWLHGLLVLGMYRVLAWVVSVMLPPMAIFFPLFTLLEDFGYLPRIAFNLDHHFKKANACGKQALTMCMGFGCNAAGVVGCRIIDSPRERLIAIITNSFVPCNGRFPTLIAIITMFFAGAVAGIGQTFISTIILTGIIILGVLLTLIVSKILSQTVLKGVPSSFTLELPPYRRPQIGKVIVRSLVDRTLFVLGRAVMVAAPAGMLIWLMANIEFSGISLLAHCSGFLDPFARILGMDGVILLAFILGFPANEIVVPIIIMAYLSSGTILEMDSLTQLKTLLVDNGWTWITAVSTMLFCLIHWPCSTTCMTIRKETQSMKWTALSFLIPTVLGMGVCFVFTTIVRLFA